MTPRRDMPRGAWPDHADHDLELVAARAADDALSTDERQAADELLQGCTDCATLANDLRLLSTTLRTDLPIPRRPRNFRLTREEATRAVPDSPWARFLAALAGPRFAFLQPLAATALSIGLVLAVVGFVGTEATGSRPAPESGAGRAGAAALPAASAGASAERAGSQSSVDGGPAEDVEAGASPSEAGGVSPTGTVRRANGSNRSLSLQPAASGSAAAAASATGAQEPPSKGAPSAAATAAPSVSSRLPGVAGTSAAASDEREQKAADRLATPSGGGASNAAASPGPGGRDEMLAPEGPAGPPPVTVLGLALAGLGMGLLLLRGLARAGRRDRSGS